MNSLLQSQAFIQAIGFVALILSIISYQSNRYRILMSVRAASEFVFSIHFLLLRVFSGSALQLIGGIRNLVFIRLENKKKRMPLAIIVFCILFTCAGIITWEGPISLLPIIAKNVSTIAYAMNNTRKIRLIEFPTYGLWLFYNIESGSIAGAINASLSLVSIAIAIIRFDIPYAFALYQAKKESKSTGGRPNMNFKDPPPK
jgi:hypothetical protein